MYCITESEQPNRNPDNCGDCGMKNNTVVTIGDINFLWGLFLLIASMRKSGMDEPVLVGVHNFPPDMEDILTQFGGVTVHRLENVDHSLTCYKPTVMRQVKTDYITWIDGDGFFFGNCSKRLPPLKDDEIHIRMRQPEENAQAFHGYEYGEDGRSIPKAVLDAWREDVAGIEEPRILRNCVASSFSIHRSALPFLEKWHEQMMKVLPAGNVGVVDHTLKYYHMLDESVLNSVLCFYPGAPRVSDEYRLDKDVNELFCHFWGNPKPWNGWTKYSFRHFDRFTAVADWAVKQGYKLPGPLPYSLDPAHKTVCRLLLHPVNVVSKIKRRLKKRSA